MRIFCHHTPPSLPRLVSSLDPPTVVSVWALHTGLFQLLRFSRTTQTFSLSFVPFSFASRSAASVSGKQQTQTNECGGVFFSSLLSSRPLPLENTSSLHLSGSDGAEARFLGTCAPPLCPAPAEERERRGSRGRSGGITTTKTHAVTVEEQHIKDDRCRASFLRKGREEQRRELLRSNRWEHANASLFAPLLPLPSICWWLFLSALAQRKRGRSALYSNLPGDTGAPAEAQCSPWPQHAEEHKGSRRALGKNTGSVRSIKGG